MSYNSTYGGRSAAGTTRKLRTLLCIINQPCLALQSDLFEGEGKPKNTRSDEGYKDVGENPNVAIRPVIVHDLLPPHSDRQSNNSK